MSTDTPQETFISHLIELRERLVKAVVAVLVATFALMAWPGMKELYSLVAAPMMHALPNGATMIATDVTGTFFIPLKVTLMAGFLISLPIVLYQVWAFVAPGLYSHEKKLVLPLVVSSTLLFMTPISPVVRAGPRFRQGSFAKAVPNTSRAAGVRGRS